MGIGIDNTAEGLQEQYGTEARLVRRASVWRAAAYLAAFNQQLADKLPFFEGERTYHGAVIVFVAR